MEELMPFITANQQAVSDAVVSEMLKGTPEESVASQANSILNSLYGIRNYNNEWSAYQAKIQRDWSSDEAMKSRLFNMVEAQKNRDWQQYMSDTAHQREIADLKAAGLNPVLSALGGQGASVGSGATASSSVPSGQKGDSDESVGMAIASILGTLLTNQERMSETLINAQLTREEGDAYREVNKLIAQLGYSAGIQEAGISASAVMHGQDLTYDYNMKHLNWQERSDMAWRILEKDKIAITKGDVQSQIDYRIGLLKQAGIDDETAKIIAEMYTSTTASEGAQNRGLSLFQTAIGALGSAIGGLSNIVKAAG